MPSASATTEVHATRIEKAVPIDIKVHPNQASPLPEERLIEPYPMT
jgi:hypothetical protein